MIHTKRILVLIGALSMLSCNPSRMAFEELADGFLGWYYQSYPVTATWIGIHEHDGRFSKRTPADSEAALRQLGSFQVQLRQIDPETLRLEDRIDYQILKESIDEMLFQFSDLQEDTWNPMEVVQEVGFGLMLLLSQEFAPLEERLGSYESRLLDLPRLLKEAQERLRNAPQVHIQTAARQIDGIVHLINEELFNLLPDLSPERIDHLKRSGAPAVDALKSFQSWLTSDLLNNSTRDFRLGKSLFDKKLAYTLREDITADQILSHAYSELTRTQAEMFALAAPLYGQIGEGSIAATHQDTLRIIRSVLDRIADDHLRRDQIIENAEKTIHELVGFIKARNIITLDEKQPLEIRATPEFQRGVSIASLEAPGPLETGLKTFYNVSPIPDDWTDEQAESFLREYNRISVKILSIHEALPGHFVQLYYSNRFPSILRSVFGSGVMIEGWAHYCEGMMIEAGFGEGDPGYALIQKKWYLRGIVNSIIDQRIHAYGMTREEAIALMVDEAFQEQSEAEAKWVRAQLTSTQLSTYFVGATEMWRLRRDVELKLGGKFQLHTFHEELLSHGSPPIKYLRRLML